MPPFETLNVKTRPLFRMLFALWLAIPLAAAGCSEGRDSATVTGLITLDGRPVADIGVTFEPKGKGARQGSFGITDSDGRYTLRFADNELDGALIGVHRIVFSDVSAASAVDDSEDDDLDYDVEPAIESRIPRRYTSDRYKSEGMEFEVKPEDNQADFELLSK